MKKYVSALLAVLILLSPAVGYAAADSISLKLSAKEVARGGAITLSGTAASDTSDVVIKIVTPNQTVLFLDVIEAAEGQYSAAVAIPTEAELAPYGEYTAIAGAGTAEARKTFAVVKKTGGHETPDPGTNPDPSPEEKPDIPKDAGQASGSVIQPALSSDGHYQIGADTLAQAMEQSEEAITIQLPAAASESGMALEFPADALNELQKRNQSVILTSGNVELLIPAGSIPVSMAEQPLVRMVLNTAWSDEAQSVVAQSLQANGEYAPTGVVLSVTIEIVSGNGTVEVHQMDKPVVVKLKLTAAQEGLIRSELAGVYYVNGQAAEYVGGTIANGTFTFTADHFSYYTILEYNKNFVDTAGHWAEDAVKFLAAKHIVTGVDERRYAPERSITRAEFVSLIMRALERTGHAAGEAPANPFSDVAAGQYYTGHVAAASSLGIVNGYGDKTFRPNEHISREEAAAALVRAEQYFSLANTVPGLPSFADAQDISSWAAASVKEAWSKGMIQGDGVSFHPKDPVTRAAVAVMIDRLLADSQL